MLPAFPGTSRYRHKVTFPSHVLQLQIVGDVLWPCEVGDCLLQPEARVQHFVSLAAGLS